MVDLVAVEQGQVLADAVLAPTVDLLGRLAAVEDRSLLRPAHGPAPHVWAQHMHEAAWAVETTGRTRLAAVAQLDLLRCLDAAAVPPEAYLFGGVEHLQRRGAGPRRGRRPRRRQLDRADLRSVRGAAAVPLSAREPPEGGPQLRGRPAVDPARELHEVLNTMASLFNQVRAPHLKLYTTFPPGEQLRPDVRELAVRSAPRDDISIDIARYGTGRMSVVVVP